MDKESNEKGESRGRGNMTGRALRWKEFFWGKEAFWRGARVLISWLGFSSSVVRVLQSLSNIAGGTELLGVLGMGPRIPFGFLELGIQTRYS